MEETGSIWLFQREDALLTAHSEEVHGASQAGPLYLALLVTLPWPLGKVNRGP